MTERAREREHRHDWAQPAVEPVAPGVHRVPLPIPDVGLTAVNVYVLTTADGFVLIDSGWATREAHRLLVDALRTLGGGLDDIRQILVTHIHRDHYGQAVQLRRSHGTRIAVGRKECPTIEHALGAGAYGMDPQLDHLRRLGGDELVDEILDEIRASALDALTDWGYPDDWLNDGERISAGERQLDVLDTPGHTQGHVVLHDETGQLLFAGDHVLPTITPSIGFEPLRSGDALGSFLRSLARLRERPDAVLCPAHGYAGGSVHARIDELAEHHERRLGATERAVVAGAETGIEVAQRLPWTRRDRRFDELNPYNQMLALSETGAHLDLLVAQGRIAVTDVPELPIGYRPVVLRNRLTGQKPDRTVGRVLPLPSD
jgi:glyoxylase-like metal-dependent hydrolase (beta-lactamase superfamily II)